MGRKVVFGVLLAATLAAMATTAQAVFINGGAGLASPATTITFSEVALGDGAVVTNQYSSLGVEFGSLSASAGLYFTSGGGNPGAGLRNYFPDTYNPFEINFATAVTEAAFLMITNGTTDTFTALLNGSVVETASAVTGAWRFYGFTGITFDQIRVGIGGDSGSGNGRHMRLDNIQIGAAAIPEPATSALLALGLFGTGAVRRRNR